VPGMIDKEVLEKEEQHDERERRSDDDAQHAL
jgi:hypothetical protein